MLGALVWIGGGVASAVALQGHLPDNRTGAAAVVLCLFWFYVGRWVNVTIAARWPKFDRWNSGG